MDSKGTSAEFNLIVGGSLPENFGDPLTNSFGANGFAMHGYCTTWGHLVLDIGCSQEDHSGGGVANGEIARKFVSVHAG